MHDYALVYRRTTWPHLFGGGACQGIVVSCHGLAGMYRQTIDHLFLRRIPDVVFLYSIFMIFSGGDGNFTLSTSLLGYVRAYGSTVPMVEDGYGSFYSIDDKRLVCGYCLTFVGSMAVYC